MNHLKEIINEPIIKKPRNYLRKETGISKKNASKKLYKIACPKSDITKRGKKMIQ